MSLRRLAQVAIRRHDQQRAKGLIQESLALNVELGDKRALAACLAACSALIAAESQLIDAVRLCGSVDALLERIHTRMLGYDRLSYERLLVDLRAQIDVSAFEAAWAEGHALTMEQAIAHALKETYG